MKRILPLLTAFILWWISPAWSDTASDCTPAKASCVLDAAWSAALLLPAEKQERLASAFLEIATLSEDPALMSKWSARFDLSPNDLKQPATYPDYGWEQARPILKAEGVDGLIQAAKAQRPPLQLARGDALLSVGLRSLARDPEAAERLNQALLDLAMNASTFEKTNLAHAASELAMRRCDLDRFIAAQGMISSQNNLRYAFWRYRIEGETQSKLLFHIRENAIDSDTAYVRQVLDGYRAVLTYGLCSAP